MMQQGTSDSVANERETVGGLSSLLLPEKRHPYYIVAPRYVRTSAGIKALHLLCHALNRLGERAYLITHPYYPPAYSTNPELNTPLLTQRILEFDFEAGLAPIVIYPETIPGNPFHAPFVVRYVLNFPGLLGGDATYGEDEFCITYSKHLAESVADSKLTLFIPVSDPRVFYPYPRVQRRGSCFYAGKYKYHHGGKLYEVTNNSVEITRDQPDSQSPDQIADLFRRSEVFYTYENTALAIEALLCECPVVFLPNPYLDQIIGIEEHGWDGIAWGTADSDIDRAKSTVYTAKENYRRFYAIFSKMLQEFIARTQDIADNRPYRESMIVPQIHASNFFLRLGETFEMGYSMLLNKGALETSKRGIRKILGR
ncbi:hypothetical protein [Acidithiobacillus ferriphilus]|uniref:hypothetical protein n=1 Tax=Acidithiobacillus ferriphilus TaxID=1689834 RepID=UPI00232FCD39|nr:hypothetical protein [Acidithiobacillus ferriphilus]WCE93919.1 hypothetical protein PJU76_13325 [Acidithiobacillus ferriphilus]